MPTFPMEVTVIPPSPFSYLIPVTLNEMPWVALVCGQTHAPGSHSVKAQANRGSGKGGALRLQPCRAGPFSALGAVVLFTVRLVPQDAVHLMCDGRWQLWKDLRRERDSEGEHALCVYCQSFLNNVCSCTSQPLDGAEEWLEFGLDVTEVGPSCLKPPAEKLRENHEL